MLKLIWNSFVEQMTLKDFRAIQFFEACLLLIALFIWEETKNIQERNDCASVGAENRNFLKILLTFYQPGEIIIRIKRCLA